MDDLQFQLLEQGVISGDVLEKTEETSEQQVATLKRQLEEERKKLKVMEERLEVLVAVCLIVMYCWRNWSTMYMYMYMYMFSYCR